MYLKLSIIFLEIITLSAVDFCSQKNFFSFGEFDREYYSSFERSIELYRCIVAVEYFKYGNLATDKTNVEKIFKLMTAKPKLIFFDKNCGHCNSSSDEEIRKMNDDYLLSCNRHRFVYGTSQCGKWFDGYKEMTARSSNINTCGSCSC